MKQPTTQEAAEVAARVARTLGVSPSVAAAIVSRTAQTGQLPAEHSKALAPLFSGWGLEEDPTWKTQLIPGEWTDDYRGADSD